MTEDSELWNVICDGLFIPMKTIGEPAVTIPKTRKEYNDTDHKSIEKNFQAKKILVYGIGPNEYTRISACQSTKEIWEALQTAHEGTTQVKMKDDESIQDMHTRFTSIINEIHSLGEINPRNKLVRKILSALPGSWESKVNAITEAKDLQKLTIDELIGNLKTYEMMKKKDHKRRERKREKNLVLMTDNNDSSGEDVDMAYLKKRFQKIVRRNGGIPNRGSSSKPRGYDLCHKCGKLVHFIKDFPLHKQDQYKHKIDKVAKRNPVPNKIFKRKDVADNVVKHALDAWRDSSSESGKDDEKGGSSMMAVESEEAEYDSIFALMANSDDDEIYDKGNKVEFVSKICTVTSLVTGEVIPMAKRYKDIYVTNFESLHNGDLTCLSAVDDDAELWHRRLGNACCTLLNKLVKKDLIRSFFKSKKEVSTSRPLDLLHMDLCGPMRVPSRGGKKYIIVIVDDYSRFTRTLYLRTKYETFLVFAAFVKTIQVKMSDNVVSIRSDHGTEFDNASCKVAATVPLHERNKANIAAVTLWGLPLYQMCMHHPSDITWGQARE
ncbi:uncharacterized protein LOC107804122 [Nicotiana tabacum]|uniref:Uncharacterized protein LOC107804122 n=1 Tax=Nicotiana tabacum TaxID=4097 RepID=A0AC58TWN1_TOBAC